MSIRSGLAFVWRESWAFLARGWWLALLAGVPFSLAEMVRWQLAPPGIGPFLAASSVTVVLDTYLSLVIIRFVTGGRMLDQALRVDAVTLRRFAPYGVFTIISGMAQYYAYLTDESLRTYLLSGAVYALLGALLAPWAVASATGAFACGPRRAIHLVAPHIVWAMSIFALLFALELAGEYLIGLVPLPLPELTLAGMTFTDVGYDLKSLVLASVLVVAGQVAVIAVAIRVGAIHDAHRALRDTFS